MQRKRQHCWLSVSLLFFPSLSHFFPLFVAGACDWTGDSTLSLRLPLDQPTFDSPYFPSFFLSRSLTLELCKLLGTFLSEGDSDLLLLIVVKVAGVTWSFELGDEGSFHLNISEGTGWGMNLSDVTWRTDTHKHTPLPFSGRWQSSRWLQTICVPWCRWPRSWGCRNVLWDPPEDDASTWVSRNILQSARFHFSVRCL